MKYCRRDEKDPDDLHSCSPLHICGFLNHSHTNSLSSVENTFPDLVTVTSVLSQGQPHHLCHHHVRWKPPWQAKHICAWYVAFKKTISTWLFYVTWWQFPLDILQIRGLGSIPSYVDPDFSSQSGFVFLSFPGSVSLFPRSGPLLGTNDDVRRQERVFFPDWTYSFLKPCDQIWSVAKLRPFSAYIGYNILDNIWPNDCHCWIKQSFSKKQFHMM